MNLGNWLSVSTSTARPLAWKAHPIGIAALGMVTILTVSISTIEIPEFCDPGLL